ncbi:MULTISPECIES: aldo/keto reductase [unclassified Devosia]|uniref:aldo/keto reductase n=1 Tax=unclassified Devosia TaxID=196773 RepID=UPI000A4BBDEA|nr:MULTISPECIES: aldo/keto reductase [unclassified Devosia]MBN9304031.1 aldo/keto reductase [Devosia sp.]
MVVFNKRKVGRTALEVTEFGFGSATLVGAGGTMVPPEQAIATIHAALDAGIGYFDTAPHYGFGRAEHLLGDALRFSDKPFALSTKVGRLLRPVRSDAERTVQHGWTQPFPFEIAYDYSYDGIMRSFEDSLQRLGLGKIDILLVHDIGTKTHGVEGNRRHWADLAGGGYRALDELRRQGLISAIGLGVNEWPVLMDALAIGDWDVFLLANRYTLLEQTPLDPLFTTCRERGTSVIAAGPFAAGILAGTNIWGPATGAYQAAPPEIMARVEALREVCRSHGVPLGAAALQFALTHPVVCSVLTGPKSPDELRQNLDWWTTPIPPALWRDLVTAGLVESNTPLPA